MPQQYFNIGPENGDQGDTPFDAFTKAEANFTELYEAAINPASKMVAIFSVADFPDAVAGVRPLASSTVYTLFTDINIGTDRFTMGNNTIVEGIGSVAVSLTYTGSSTLFTSNDNPCVIRDLTISATATGARVVEFSTTSLKVLRMDNCTVLCDRFADLSGTDWAARFGNVTIIPFTSSAVTCSGTCRSFNYFSAGIVPTSGIIFDLGSCVFQSGIISRVACNLPAGTTFISGLANSDNVSATGRFYVEGCQIDNTGGTNLVNVNAGDARWTFLGNVPIADSRNDFLVGFENNTTNDTTISTAGTYVKVNSGDTFSEDHANGFTTDNTGRVTSNVVQDFQFPADIAVSMEPVSGANKDLAVKIAINGVVQGFELPVRTSAGSPVTATIPFQPSLSENDYIEVWVANLSDTTDILVRACSFRGN